jgi:hypothetical protein
MKVYRALSLRRQIMTNEKDNNAVASLIEAVLNDTSDTFIVRETLKRLEGKDTITIKDIRDARNAIFEGKPDGK